MVWAENYIMRVSEYAIKHFISQHDNLPNIKSLILAGSSNFKHQLYNSKTFDPRLLKITQETMIDVAYGGDNGFNQAIEQSKMLLIKVAFVHEQNLLSQFFSEIAKDTCKICFGVKETVGLLLSGAVKELIVYDTLDIFRYTLRIPDLEDKNDDVVETTLVYLTEAQALKKYFITNSKIQIIDKMLLLDWLVENYKRFGASLQLVSNRSQEGSQFCKGFGGIGGILQYKIDNENQCYYNSEDEQIGNEDIDFFI